MAWKRNGRDGEGVAIDRLGEQSPPVFIAAVSGALTKLVFGAHAERQMLLLWPKLASDSIAQRAFGAAAEGMRLAYAAARVWSAVRTISRQERQRVAG